MVPLTHAAINADDVEVTVAFYERVFGWTFEEAAPGFYRADADGTVIAVQERRSLDPHVKTTGFECTMGVGDLEAAAEAVVAAGGRILMEPTHVPGVGELIFFADPSGNVAGAMRYDAT
ncbi:MAG: uncharacterized protein QOF76_211 [Solirubrobacteraceae bacterium]|nr:uncharacterized protein [Solirubrobacteraceae bacterium]